MQAPHLAPSPLPRQGIWARVSAAVPTRIAVPRHAHDDPQRIVESAPTSDPVCTRRHGHGPQESSTPRANRLPHLFVIRTHDVSALVVEVEVIDPRSLWCVPALQRLRHGRSTGLGPGHSRCRILRSPAGRCGNACAIPCRFPPDESGCLRKCPWRWQHTHARSTASPSTERPCRLRRAREPSRGPRRVCWWVRHTKRRHGSACRGRACPRRRAPSAPARPPPEHRRPDTWPARGRAARSPTWTVRHHPERAAGSVRPSSRRL